jgi:hypothetical protein
MPQMSRFPYVRVSRAPSSRNAALCLNSRSITLALPASADLRTPPFLPLKVSPYRIPVAALVCCLQQVQQQAQQHNTRGAPGKLTNKQHPSLGLRAPPYNWARHHMYSRINRGPHAAVTGQQA